MVAALTASDSIRVGGLAAQLTECEDECRFPRGRYQAQFESPERTTPVGAHRANRGTCHSGVAAIAAMRRPNGVMVREAEKAAPHAHMSVGPAETTAGARPETVVKPLSCTACPHIPGKSITTALVEPIHPRTVIRDP
jgi:hypothetical protein